MDQQIKYSCPICGEIATNDSLISSSEITFNISPDPHYSWVETHNCKACNITYTIKNNT